MQSGPEGHAGIEPDNDIVGLSAIASPGRYDDNSRSNSVHREIALPCICPFSVGHLLDGWRAHLSKLREVPQSLLQRCPALLRLRVERDVSDDSNRSGRIDVDFLTITTAVHRLVNGDAGAVLGEELGDRLDGLTFSLDDDLQPLGFDRLNAPAGTSGRGGARRQTRP